MAFLLTLAKLAAIVVYGAVFDAAMDAWLACDDMHPYDD